MRYFAQLNNHNQTIVQAVFDWDVPGVNPECHPSIPQPIEVTALTPRPAAGWTYNPDTGAFIAPA